MGGGRSVLRGAALTLLHKLRVPSRLLANPRLNFLFS